MSKIWKEILTVIESLLVPPLSDKPSEMRPLNDKEVYIVIRWLKGLSNFFYAGGEGMPIEDIQNARFRHLLALPLFYEMPTDDLSKRSHILLILMMSAHWPVNTVMECNRTLNGLLMGGNNTVGMKRSLTRSKSVFQQRNMGTIKQHKKDKQKDDNKASGSPEMMMRILRTRNLPGVQEFLSQQLETLQKIQQVNSQPPPAAARKTGRGAEAAKRKRLGAMQSGSIPPVPHLK